MWLWKCPFKSRNSFIRAIPCSMCILAFALSDVFLQFFFENGCFYLKKGGIIVILLILIDHWCWSPYQSLNCQHILIYQVYMTTILSNKSIWRTTTITFPYEGNCPWRSYINKFLSCISWFIGWIGLALSLCHTWLFENKFGAVSYSNYIFYFWKHCG